MSPIFIKLILYLLSINSIFANNDYYMACQNGTYGETCKKNCTCTIWSSSNVCSKIQGRCLNCKFGHFGTDCNSKCYPTCKTNLCCIITSSNFKDSNNKLTIKNSILSLEIKNKPLSISVDYNVGHPLTIFHKTVKDLHLDNPSEKNYSYEFTNYNVTGKKYEKYIAKFKNQNDFNKELPLPIILDEKNGEEGDPINGVIGLGFYNSINRKLYQMDNSIENIASYRKNEEDITILFGDLYEIEKKYVHKLSFCEAVDKDNDTKTGLDIQCELSGFGSKTYKDMLKINNTFIKFSLDRHSSYVLPYNDKYIKYIENYYFKGENYIMNKSDDNSNLTFCYKTEKLNRLSEFGFVINHFFYYFSVESFFSQTDSCPNDYSTFSIKFSNKNPEFIFGKNLYNDTEFTIDNEEKKIYFYSKNVEYFSGELKPEINEALTKEINPIVWSAIIVAISVFLNIVSFLIYFLCKRRKEKLKYKIQ